MMDDIELYWKFINKKYPNAPITISRNSTGLFTIRIEASDRAIEVTNKESLWLVMRATYIQLYYPGEEG